MTPEDSETLLAQLLAPQPLDAFLDGVLGKRFLVLNGEAGRAARRAIAGPDIEGAILADYERLGPKLGCHAANPLGPPPPTEMLADAEALKRKVEAYHALAYTVRLPAMRSIVPEIARIVRALEVQFHQPAEAEIFWSRGDARAPVHYDECDIIVVQLKGRKRWFISEEGTELPNAWHNAGYGAAQLGRHATVEVEPGDLIYLPRGTPHRVDALADSIHVSIGFTPLTLREALIACIDLMSDLQRPLREAIGERLPEKLRGGRLGDMPERVRTAANVLLDACATPGFVAEALQQRSSRAIGNLPKLDKPTAPVALTPDTRLRHSPLMTAHLTAT